MQYFWLNKQVENKDIIVFFNGWAMNETPIKHLDTEGFDILVLSDYRKINFDFKTIDFSKYQKKYLICWSMGVYASNLFYNELEKFDKKIAINGTNKIIDNNFGIPEKIYKVTVKFLNEDSLDKFIKNMFNQGKLNPQITITRSLEELREELVSIQNFELKEELKFDKALISLDDRIVPTKNQLNFWQDKAQIEQVQGTHCMFENYKSWQELLC